MIKKRKITRRILWETIESLKKALLAKNEEAKSLKVENEILRKKSLRSSMLSPSLVKTSNALNTTDFFWSK